jgi:hypothetical protein
MQATRSCGTARSPALDGNEFGVVVGGEMPHWPIRHRAWIGTGAQAAGVLTMGGEDGGTTAREGGWERGKRRGEE